MRNAILAACVAALTTVASTASIAAEAVKIPTQDWPFGGLFGTFDRGALQRGFQVYNNVCAGCHSLRLVAYRNLQEIGLSEDQVKEIAASKEVTDGPNDAGEMFKRPAQPSDKFVSPFPNDNAARAANNGALPPDLSLMVKARKGGADYLHALMTGYKEPPAGVTMPEGMSYNAYFPGHNIAMPPPLSEGGVEYADKTE
ncbi:MAG: cytochrome c1, partial [Alphaproteobacteria bacterium]|nr:cytochrome c1 [Alphaproteobacteria bacterium]